MVVVPKKTSAMKFLDPANNYLNIQVKFFFHHGDFAMVLTQLQVGGLP
jgi:hypothetical protein